MLSEDEVRNVIAVHRDRLVCIVDEDSRRCCMAFIAGLELVLDD